MNARNARQQTPLHLGVGPMDNQEICGLLLDAGADKDALDGDHRTALPYAIGGWGNCASVLLEKGAEPNRPDRAGKSPMALAKEKNFGQLVALMEKR